MNDGLNKAKDSSLELSEGTKELSSGTDKLNREGINKINSYAVKMKKQASKVEALVSLSKEYKGYSSDNSDSTMFIYLVKSLKSNN